MSQGNPEDLKPEVNVTNDNPEGKTVVAATVKNGNVTTPLFSTAPSNSAGSGTPIATSNAAPKPAPVIPLSEFQSLSADPSQALKGGLVSPVGKSGQNGPSGKRFNLSNVIAFGLLSAIFLVIFFTIIFTIDWAADTEWVIAAFAILVFALLCLVKFIQELRRPRV